MHYCSKDVKVGDVLEDEDPWVIISSIEIDEDGDTVVWATDEDGGEHEIAVSKIL